MEKSVAEIVWERLEEHGYGHLRSKYPGKHMSAIKLAEIAEEVGRSTHWLLTGERHPYEPKISHCTQSYPFDD